MVAVVTRNTRTSAAPPAGPAGTLFFIHGANETSEGLTANVTRIEDQVRKRGWDVQVVAPEWRRRSGLRLGTWQKALYRGRPPPLVSPSVRAGLGKAAVMKLVTDYFEGRRVALLDTLGAQLLADALGYQKHRASIQEVLKTSSRRRSRRPAAGRSCRSGSASAGSPWSTCWRAGPRRRSRRA